jgi:hypothetical protein
MLEERVKARRGRHCRYRGIYAKYSEIEAARDLGVLLMAGTEYFIPSEMTKAGRRALFVGYLR